MAMRDCRQEQEAERRREAVAGDELGNGQRAATADEVDLDRVRPRLGGAGDPGPDAQITELFGGIARLVVNRRDKGFDAEIIERHHRYKKDSPSGTAAQFAREIQDVWGHDFAIQHGREGLVGERPAKEIGMHAVRAGDNVGEHTIVFSTLGETLELVHKGHSRDAYARGAIAAAKFLAGKAPGRYTMNDVLGL